MAEKLRVMERTDADEAFEQERGASAELRSVLAQSAFVLGGMEKGDSMIARGIDQADTIPRSAFNSELENNR